MAASAFGSRASVYSRHQAAIVLVYQLLLTLFSYSFGPVTPWIMYLPARLEKWTRSAQKRLMPTSTSMPSWLT
ncbi:Uncharacterised protein [Mycobacteroides abscessus subsp. abscessus]|nr:Uncharacterised protein [Mycobacteroides abscessus subsp. abscessus]